MNDNFQKLITSLKTLLKSFRNYLIFQIAKLYYILFKKDYYHFHHLEIFFENFKLSWRWTDHSTYVQKKELALKQLKPELAPEEFIDHAFDECKHCNFLIFRSNLDQNLFLQFWLADGDIEFNFPMLPGNKLAPYKYQVMGLLAIHDFCFVHTQSEKLLKRKHRNGFILTPFDKGETIVANFHDYQTNAAQFTLSLIQDIFELEWDEVGVRVG